MYPYNFNNQNMLNQLIRQKENVENMINQYSQPQNQAPIQNIINQGSNIDFEARILTNGEDVSNIGIMRKTLFVDEANKKVIVKEIDGSISKEYEIVIPLDEKDKKILDLENKLKEMEDKFNEYSKLVRANDGGIESIANVNGDDTKKSTKSIKSI